MTAGREKSRILDENITWLWVNTKCMQTWFFFGMRQKIEEELLRTIRLTQRASFEFRILLGYLIACNPM